MLHHIFMLFFNQNKTDYLPTADKLEVRTSDNLTANISNELNVTISDGLTGNILNELNSNIEQNLSASV